MTDNNFKVKNGLTVGGDINVSGAVTAYASVNNQTTSYELVSSDNGNIVVITSGSATTVTLPNDSVLPIGSQVVIVQGGGNYVSIVGDTGVTVNSSINNSGGNLRTRVQWSSITAIKYSSNAWVLVGDIY
jgi:hypothetical protein